MPTTNRHPLRIGALLWPQTDSWSEICNAARTLDAAGLDSIWTWDHLMAIVGRWEQPILEGWTLLAGLAAVTQRPTLGLMVGANTFRNPGLTTKLATTLDHISNGRAYLGIGGAWFQREHEGYGIDFGSGSSSGHQHTRRGSRARGERPRQRRRRGGRLRPAGTRSGPGTTCLAIFGPWEQPIFEGWMDARRARPVTTKDPPRADGRREHVPQPGLTAKLATTLDHVSDGRAVLGIGGAWFEREHDAFGIDFGAGSASGSTGSTRR
jgi:alkanesulfonate monooxygenase SsuD/methylene tetrahydromethanopterin reductase-like flavin-dependent oxidoreductase (luciferase family)